MQLALLPLQREAIHSLPHWLWRLLSLATVVLLLAEYGFYLPPALLRGVQVAELAVGAIFLLDFVTLLIRARDRSRLLKRRWPEALLTSALLIAVIGLVVRVVSGSASATLTADPNSPLFGLALSGIQLYLFLGLLVSFMAGMGSYLGVRLAPPLLLSSTFLGVIVSGGLMLMLPKAVLPGVPSLSAIEAFFTATSAVTVTGLSTIDPGARLSGFGVAILGVLIQVGGLSLVTLVGAAVLATARRLDLSQLMTLGEALGSKDLNVLRKMLLGILVWTFGMEALGTILLVAQGAPLGPWHDSPWAWSLFHTVSAFCNAGFALQTDNLMSLAHQPGILLTFALLIVVGGLGFPTLLEITRRVNDLIRRRRTHGLRLHASMALWGTALLLIVGALAFQIFEARGVMRPFSGFERFGAVVFQSATLRTAGFNSIPFELISSPTFLICLILMAIGAGPISTGGGIKVSTVSVLLLTLRSMIFSQTDVVSHRHRIPENTVRAAIATFIFYIITATTVLLGLTLVAPQVPFMQLLFETISALSTVGLSQGATVPVGTPGQLLLMVAMFLGRIGPLTLFLSIGMRRSQPLVRYPSEEIIVG